MAYVRWRERDREQGRLSLSLYVRPPFPPFSFASSLSLLHRPRSAACNGLTRSRANLYAAKFIWYPGRALVPSHFPLPSRPILSILPLLFLSPFLFSLVSHLPVSIHHFPPPPRLRPSYPSCTPGQHRRERVNTRANTYTRSNIRVPLLLRAYSYVFISACIQAQVHIRSVYGVSGDPRARS